jgi:hypothetical protein
MGGWRQHLTGGAAFEGAANDDDDAREMTTKVDALRPHDRGEAGRVALGVAVPLVMLALVYALWWISNELLYVGPLDRAAFGWSVVIPLWIATPVVSAFLWRPLTVRAANVSAILVGATVSVVAAILLWRPVSQPGCEFGASRQPVEWVAPSLFVGIVVGSGLAISGLVALRFIRRGQPWRALILGALAEFAMVFAAIGATAYVLVGGSCQLPH